MVQLYRGCKLRLFQNDLVGKESSSASSSLKFIDLEVHALKTVKPLPARWSSRRERQLIHCTSENERQTILEDERQRWLLVLAGYLYECRLPVVIDVVDHPKPLRLLSKAFGAKRPSTLRRRAKTWA